MFERSPTATIKVKKAEKSLLDVSNSSAATDGSVKKLLQFCNLASFSECI